MSKEQETPAVMYGPPEMFFEEKYLVEEELRRIFVVAAIFVKDNPNLNDNDNANLDDNHNDNNQQPTANGQHPIANTQQPKPTTQDSIATPSTQILACQRAYGKWQGWWEFPGGKIEPGESDQDALRREIREEMEIDIDILRYYDTIDYRYDDFLMTMHLYLCKMPNPNFVLNDHSDARWLSRDQLSSVRWLPADIELITRWTRSGFDF